jgi:phosphoglycerate-specific signal transduction histidine kinase
MQTRGCAAAAEKPDLEDLRAILDDIGRDLHRAGGIIDHMRQLFKQRAIQMQPLKVEEVLQNVGELVRRKRI